MNYTLQLLSQIFVLRVKFANQFFLFDAFIKYVDKNAIYFHFQQVKFTTLLQRNKHFSVVFP